MSKVYKMHEIFSDSCLADDSKGYFIPPTVIQTKDPKSITMVEEIFGPVMTVRHLRSRQAR